jgi:cytochrome c oxidase assembly factor CtaG
VFGLILLTAAAAVCLLFGAAQAAAGRDYRWILWPLQVFLLIGAVGQSLDLIGGSLTPEHLVGLAILAPAAPPVLLLSTAAAKRYLTATGPKPKSLRIDRRDKSSIAAIRLCR